MNLSNCQVKVAVHSCDSLSSTALSGASHLVPISPSNMLRTDASAAAAAQWVQFTQMNGCSCTCLVYQKVWMLRLLVHCIFLLLLFFFGFLEKQFEIFGRYVFEMTLETYKICNAAIPLLEKVFFICNFTHITRVSSTNSDLLQH